MAASRTGSFSRQFSFALAGFEAVHGTPRRPGRRQGRRRRLAPALAVRQEGEGHPRLRRLGVCHEQCVGELVQLPQPGCLPEEAGVDIHPDQGVPEPVGRGFRGGTALWGLPQLKRRNALNLSVTKLSSIRTFSNVAGGKRSRAVGYGKETGEGGRGEPNTQGLVRYTTGETHTFAQKWKMGKI